MNMETLVRSLPNTKVERVVIVGAGFSGTMQAINLLRYEGPDVVLIERSPEAGRGVAYSALFDDHILNVRASNMSAFPDDPGHFVRWLGERGLGEPTDFVARRTYGDYLSELLDDATRAAPGRLTLLYDDVTDLAPQGAGFRLTMRSGATREADAVVLAVGNLPPHEVRAIADADLDEDRHARNPWSQTIADDLDSSDEVLIVGTGLTMVDAALFLERRGFRGRILAMSRRGLLPRPHDDPVPPPERLSEKPGTLSSRLLAKVRGRAKRLGWRNAVDELRPYTQTIWRAADETERARFLRHLRPWWDVHRHRIAPQVAERLERLQSEGRLVPLAGSILAVERADRGTIVRWRPRGSNEVASLRVRRIINCTGPQGDLDRTGEPLLRNLIARGMIRPDALHLGIDVNQQGEVIAADGEAHPHLFAMGPMTRGAFWEIVAVPDIRVQSWALARRLCDAYWVGGEGL